MRSLNDGLFDAPELSEEACTHIVVLPHNLVVELLRVVVLLLYFLLWSHLFAIILLTKWAGWYSMRDVPPILLGLACVP